MARLSTLNLLEQALQREAQIFHTLISSLSQEEALEVAFFLSSTKVVMPTHVSEEVPDKILLVAKNIENIMNALDNFYVS
jgi:hypothetical protein